MAFSNLFQGGFLNAIYRNEETPRLAGLPEKAELDVELREIFKMYAAIEAADPPAFLPKIPDEPRMGPRAFSVFVRDAKLLDSRTTLSDARAVIYETLNNRKTAGEAARGDGLRYEDWLEALWMFSDRFAGLAPVDAAAALLATHISGARRWAPPPAEAADGVCDPELQSVLEEHWRPLQQIFVFYGRRALPPGARLAFSDALARGAGLSLPEFTEFLTDFGLCPPPSTPAPPPRWGDAHRPPLPRLALRGDPSPPPEQPASDLTGTAATESAQDEAPPEPSPAEDPAGPAEGAEDLPPPLNLGRGELPAPPAARLHYSVIRPRAETTRRTTGARRGVLDASRRGGAGTAFLEALAVIALEHFGEAPAAPSPPPPPPPAPDSFEAMAIAANPFASLPPAASQPPKLPRVDSIPKGPAGAKKRLARVRALMRVLDLHYGPRFGVTMQEEMRGAPPTKPRPAPVILERRPGLLNDEEEAALRRIWLIYSAVGERHVDTTSSVRPVPPRKGGMTAFQWALFVRNSSPGGEELSDGVAAELFDRAVRFGETVEGLMYFTGFKRGVRLLSKLRMRRTETPDDAYRAYVAKLVRRAHQDLFVVRARIRGPAPKREIDPLAAELARITRRAVRSLDIFCGPVLVGRADDAPGRVRQPPPVGGTAGFASAARIQGDALARKHPFLDVWMFEDFVKARLEAHVDLAESFDHFVRRLRRDGFDLAPSWDPETRKPVGRCWHIKGKGSQGPSTHVATLFDYPGQFGTLRWQATDGCAEHSEVCMCVYEEGEEGGGASAPGLDGEEVEQGRLVLDLYGCFSKARTAAQLRHRLASKGFSLAPVLYTPH
eukprot:tig00000691_g3165.t1